MNVYRLIGFGLGLLSAAVTWQFGVIVYRFFTGGGVDYALTLLFDPDYSLRTLAFLAAFTAGLSALTEVKGGSWLAGLSMSLLFVQAMAMLGGRGAIDLWLADAVILASFTCLFLAMTAARGAEYRKQQLALSA